MEIRKNLPPMNRESRDRLGVRFLNRMLLEEG